MPTYEYHCTKCGGNFETVQSMKDPHFEVCPRELCQQKDEWGEGKVKRQMGAGAGLIFKGSGFYITDYRSDKYKESAKKDSGAAAPATSSATPSGGGSGEAAKPKSDAPAAPAPKPSAPAPSKSSTDA